jgi:hypothetical protein
MSRVSMPLRCTKHAKAGRRFNSPSALPGVKQYRSQLDERCGQPCCTCKHSAGHWTQTREECRAKFTATLPQPSSAGIPDKGIAGRKFLGGRDCLYVNLLVVVFCFIRTLSSSFNVHFVCFSFLF